jgi:hypothetical protein
MPCCDIIEEGQAWANSRQSSGLITLSILGGDAQKYRLAAHIATQKRGQNDMVMIFGGHVNLAVHLVNSIGKNRSDGID